MTTTDDIDVFNMNGRKKYKTLAAISARKRVCVAELIALQEMEAECLETCRVIGESDPHLYYVAKKSESTLADFNRLLHKLSLMDVETVKSSRKYQPPSVDEEASDECKLPF